MIRLTAIDVVTLKIHSIRNYKCVCGYNVFVKNDQSIYLFNFKISPRNTQLIIYDSIMIHFNQNSCLTTAVCGIYR